MNVEDFHGVKVLLVPSEGPRLRSDRDAVNLIGEAGAHRARMIAVPVERFDPDFFRLKTRIAGEFLQKFVIYQVRLAVVGDISAFVDESSALSDFVRESNRGQDVWFVANHNDLRNRLAGAVGG